MLQWAPLGKDCWIKRYQQLRSWLWLPLCRGYQEFFSYDCSKPGSQILIAVKMEENGSEFSLFFIFIFPDPTWCHTQGLVLVAINMKSWTSFIRRFNIIKTKLSNLSIITSVGVFLQHCIAISLYILHLFWFCTWNCALLRVYFKIPKGRICI